MSKYITESDIRYSKVDSQLNLSYLSLCEIIQDATTNWLRANQLNNDYLLKNYQVILVVIHNQLHLMKKIPLNSHLGCQVSIVKKTLASFVLETKVIDTKTEEVVVLSDIEICAMDAIKRCLYPVHELEEIKKINVMEKEFPVKFSRMFPTTEPNVILTQRVESTDIDFSQHLNNIAYWRYLLNCFTSQQLATLPFKEFEIQYIKEAIEGKQLIIRKYTLPDGYLFIINNDDTLIAKAKITMES